MNRCIIVGAGDCNPALIASRTCGELFIAADGGLPTLLAAGITPDYWIGDCDSLSEYPSAIPAKRLPTVKDDTDLIAACRYGLSQGFRSFLLYGVLGGERFSHSIAAVQTLTFLKDNGADALILDERARIRLLRNETVSVTETANRFFSLFALSEDASVSITGAKYPLTHARLSAHFPLGISNEFDLPTEIAAESGDVLLVIDG